MCLSKEHYTCLTNLLRIASLVCFLSGMYHAGLIATEARTVQTNTTVSNITRNWGLWIKCTINETNGTVQQECSALYPGETAAYYEGARVFSCLAFFFFLCQFTSICWKKDCTGTAPAFYTFVGVVLTALVVVVVGGGYSNDAHWRDLSPSLGWCYWLELCTVGIGIITTAFLYHKGRLESDGSHLFCACLIARYRSSSPSSGSQSISTRHDDNGHSHVDVDDSHDGAASAEGQQRLQHRRGLFQIQSQLSAATFTSSYGGCSGEREGRTCHVEFQLTDASYALRELPDIPVLIQASPTTRTLPSSRQTPSRDHVPRLFPLLILPPYEESLAASNSSGNDVPPSPPPSYEDVLLELSSAATQTIQTVSNP